MGFNLIYSTPMDSKYDSVGSNLGKFNVKNFGKTAVFWVDMAVSDQTQQLVT